jgi:hypothetical protein
MFIATCKLITAPWILSPIWSNNAHDSWILVLVNIRDQKPVLQHTNLYPESSSVRHSKSVLEKKKITVQVLYPAHNRMDLTEWDSSTLPESKREPCSKNAVPSEVPPGRSNAQVHLRYHNNWTPHSSPLIDEHLAPGCRSLVSWFHCHKP